MNERTSQHPGQASSAIRVGIRGAILTIIAIPVSGPIGLAVVEAIGPSPPWNGPELYARSYHPIQNLPFFAGFGLIIGYAMMMAALYRISEEKEKTQALIAVIFTAAFVALIFFNYINQTTFVPGMAQTYRHAYDPIITALSMANPGSLAWGIEMWGYALLGGATWFAAPIFNQGGLERVTAMLMTANGVISIAGGIATAWHPAWVMTTPGMISYMGWNVVVFALSICVFVALRRRLAR